MGLRDHFVADHIKHRAACKGQGKGQYCSGKAHGEIPQQSAQNFHKTGDHGDHQGPLPAHAGGQHGGDDDHTFGDVLQRNTGGDGHSLTGVACAEAHTGSDALRQIVDADGQHE